MDLRFWIDGGVYFYPRPKPLTRMKRQYILRDFGAPNAKQLALWLDCFEEFAYQTIRETNAEDAPDLFTEAQ